MRITFLRTEHRKNHIFLGSSEAPKERWQSRNTNPITGGRQIPFQAGDTCNRMGRSSCFPSYPGGSRFRLPERSLTRLFFFATAKLNSCCHISQRQMLDFHKKSAARGNRLGMKDEG